MDIVYTLGKNCAWENYEEFRYSLRSLKFIEHNKVWVVGVLPEWTINVNHIPFPDIYATSKDANLINKLLRVCYENELSEQFIFNSDDQYFIEPYQIRYLHNGELKIGVDTKHGKTIFNTRDILKSQGKPIFNFDTHTPVLIDKKKYPEIMLQSAWAQGNNGILVNSYYFNTLLQYKQIDVVENKKGLYFYNHSNMPTDIDREYLTNIFSEKSLYEK